MADKFCRSYTDKIFNKYDQNGNNVLDRGELKLWLRQEMSNNANTFMKKTDVKEKFLNLIANANADTNGDGKIDRWEMYEYCIKTTPVSL